MILPTGVMAMKQAKTRILVATDLSEMFEPLIDIATLQAHQQNAELIVLYVFSRDDYLQVLRDATVTYDEYVSCRRAEIRGRIERRTGTKIHSSIEVVSGIAPVGDEIILAATRLRVNLMMIGAHGRAGLQLFLLGRSVAGTVLRKATCPVLVIPTAALEAERTGHGPLNETPAISTSTTSRG